MSSTWCGIITTSPPLFPSKTAPLILLRDNVLQLGTSDASRVKAGPGNSLGAAENFETKQLLLIFLTFHFVGPIIVKAVASKLTRRINQGLAKVLFFNLNLFHP